MQNLFTGDLVRLVAIDPELGGIMQAQWYRDSEFTRLYDMPPVMPKDANRTKERALQAAESSSPNVIRFHIETLAERKLIGECDLERSAPTLDEAFVAIGVGDRAFWGRGYGTDAMRLLLRYGFQEWNLHRISLSVFGYNPRAVKSYEKVGMKHEGRRRAALKRGGERFDLLYMGVLRREWEAAQHG